MIAAKVSEEPTVRSAVGTDDAPQIGLEQYYSEAGPDYAAWSRKFNMHFGYYRAGANPLHREAMLEQMNIEVLARLQVDGIAEPRLIDLGCGLGATLRSFARRLPGANLLGVTRVPWQVEQARALNEVAGFKHISVIEADYEHSLLPSSSYDGVYALESSCHAHGADKGMLLEQRTVCCDQVDVSLLLTDFLKATAFWASCRSASTTSCASAGSSISWHNYTCSGHDWKGLASGKSRLRICRCVLRLRSCIFHG